MAVGSAAHVDNDDTEIVLVQTVPASDAARLSSLVLGSLRLVLIDFAAPHVAFVSPVPASVLVSFAADNRKPPPVLDGLAMAPGEIAIHGVGEAFHVRSDGSCKIGLIAIGPRDFARYARALLGKEVEPTPSARVLRLPSPALRDIRRLHAQALRLNVTKPALLARREVARALEQDLIHALLDGVGAAEPRRSPQPNPRHAEIVARFQEMLAAPGRLPSLAELCAALDVPERLLRHCCRAFLGCSPLAYARLRRASG